MLRKVAIIPTKLAKRSGLEENERIALKAYLIQNSSPAFERPCRRGDVSKEKEV